MRTETSDFTMREDEVLTIQIDPTRGARGTFGRVPSQTNLANITLPARREDTPLAGHLGR